ncbi:MAG TPA: elongation factor-1 alpha [Candidatus Tenderia sp.]|nr:elongation factor-1 alpha [Candidatus Tenderia sp.]
MSSMLPASESVTIVSWLHTDMSEEVFNKEILPILETRCTACHDGSNPHIPNLTSFENVKTVTVVDTGVSVGTLVRVSHIHLFGLAFIFAFMGLIFSHAYVRRIWLKNVIIILPFAAIFLDVMSWWLTKVAEPFGYIIFASGALMGVSFAFQWCVSMYQLWFFKCPDDEVCVVP